VLQVATGDLTERKERVLLVDDYPDALEMWGLYLTLSGYEVVTAEDGIRAVELARTVAPDVIVMDLELPGLTGLDAARQLRTFPETASIPLIAATGYSQRTLIDRAHDAGFDTVLIKPCDPATLAATIERVLDRARVAGEDGQPTSIIR